ncbi:hypothetical protein LX97_02955 [Nonlabens dokdonensis]|jgi:hypothetical protein|uniref:Uncharacterized protein n=2 Tax=Nonlabens dokdonensis TaxID=328515 RepID=L7WE90_NONDD|nr:hypothetical protein [Nonlabens dokdonensis]AGC78251.1 hypothetical protein DDD_3124 [Nonlabens dokdonensis DSW-6]PZX37860.1 hypothetical protein LX97_02955 [Nonlabens dokdonensis]
MKLKNFTSELVTAWRKREQGLYGMAGVVENKEIGIKGEKYVLTKLRKDYPEYEFCLTDYSWTPADIIGFKKDSQMWHFALFQVKTSKFRDQLSSEIIEKQTLPILAKILKQVFIKSDETKYYKNREVYITIGYVGVYHSNGRNNLVLKKPYGNDFSLNQLSLNSTEKTKMKNNIHR